MSNTKKVTASSGNVFADRGFASPEEELLTAKLVREIRGIIKRRMCPPLSPSRAIAA